MATERIEIVLTSRGTRTVQRDIRGIGQASQATRRALGFLRSALVVVASARILQGFLDLADSFTLIRNRLRLLTASTGELNTVQNSLFQLSQRTRTSFEANVELFSRTARATQSLGLNFRELLKVTEATALAIKISGATSQEAKNSLIQFSQGLAAGALRGDELRSVVEQFPRLAAAIGKEFGVAGGQLAAFAKANEGVLTTDRIIKALSDEFGVLNTEFNKTLPTISDGFTRLQNALVLFFGGLNDATGAGQALANLLVTIANNIDKVVLALGLLASIAVFNFLLAQLAAVNGSIIALGRSTVIFSRTLLSAFTVLLAPVTLLRTSLILVGATAVAAFTPLIRGANLAVGAIALLSSALLKVTKTLIFFSVASVRNLRLLLTPLGLLVAAFNVVSVAARGALLAIVAPVALLKNLFLALRVAVLANPLFVTGAALVAGVIAAFFIFRDQISAVIEKLGGLKGIFESVVTFAVAAVQTIVRRWQQLPAAFADIAIQAANNLVKFLESAINKVIAGLNKIPGVDITPADLPTIRNAFAGAADAIRDDFVGALNSVKDAGGGVKVVADQFGRITEFLGRFTGTNLEIDPALLENLPTIAGGAAGELGKVDKELKKVRNSLERLLGSISPAVDFTIRLAEANKTLADAAAKGIDVLEEFGITEAEVIRRVQRELVGVGNAATDVAEKRQLLSQAFSDGIISANEYQRALRDLRVDATALDDSLSGGLRNGLARIAADLNNFNEQISDAVVDTFHRATDAIVEFARTGKFNLRQFFGDLFADLARLALNQTFASLVSGFLNSTGFGGGIGRIFGGGLGLPGFASGGSFEVGANTSVGNVSGRDNRLIAFRARDRETVTVTPPGGAASGSGGGTVNNITLNINGVTDADSFRRSQAQIASRLSESLRRAQRRDT